MDSVLDRLPRWLLLYLVAWGPLAVMALVHVLRRREAKPTTPWTWVGIAAAALWAGALMLVTNAAGAMGDPDLVRVMNLGFLVSGGLLLTAWGLALFSRRDSSDST